jgi:phage-related protein
VQKIVETAFDAIFKTVDVVVEIFKDVSKAIETAIGWLSSWDKKEPKSKTIKVNEERTTSTRRTEHATGTNYFGGGQTLVGERGAELVTLPRGSKISPANATRNSLGGLGSQGDIVIEVPVILEGREVARGTYRYISELNAADTRNSMRARGLSV